jgi:uncharacterized membrane protein YccC
VKKTFQIVLTGRPTDPTERPGVVRRLRAFLGGVIAAAFIGSTLIVAILIGTTIALTLWIVIAIILVAAIIRVTFRRRLRNPAPDE